MRVGTLCVGLGLIGWVAAGCGEDAQGPGTASGGHAGAEDQSGAGGSKGGSSGHGASSGTSATSGRGGKGNGTAGNATSAAGTGDAGQPMNDAGRGGTNGDAGGPGSGASLLPSFKSGSRLKVRQYRAGDMPPVFVSFYDSKLESDCEFSDAGTGLLYCLPQTGLLGPSASGSLFADENCTEPVATADLGCVSAGDSFVYESQATEDCGSLVNKPYRAIDLGENPTLYADDGGGCMERSVTGGTTRYYRVEDVELTEFVQGKLDVIESPTGLSVKRLVASDGAYQARRLVETASKKDCRLFDFDGDSRCVPLPVFSGRNYRTRDPECSEPLSLRYCGDDVPEYVVDTPDGLTYTVLDAGPEYTGDVYGNSGTCEAVTEPGPYYEVGAEVQPSQFVGSTREYAGSGRLKHSVLLDDGGTELAAGSVSGLELSSIGGLYDSDFDSACFLYRDSDAKSYCIPNTVPFAIEFSLPFADADCTLPLADCGRTGCPDDLALVGADTVQPVCGFRADFSRLDKLGDDYTGAEYYVYSTSNSACEGPYDADPGTFRVVTGEGSLSVFATVETVVE